MTSFGIEIVGLYEILSVKYQCGAHSFLDLPLILQYKVDNRTIPGAHQTIAEKKMPIKAIT